MTIYTCKMCGRGLKAESKPNFCYYDRMSSIENISDEDAVKMGLFSATKGEERDGIVYEFSGDIKYHPFTGDLITELGFCGGQRLTDFQNAIMRKVINNE